MDATTQAVLNALAMSDFVFDNDASQTRDRAVAGLIAELGEQGYAIVAVAPVVEEHIAIVSTDGEYHLTYSTHGEFLTAVAGLHNDGIPAVVKVRL